MKDHFESYDVTGGYTHDGSEGTFKGHFRLYENGRLVGMVKDQGPDIMTPEEAKLILGLSDQEGRMNFWKLARNSNLAPLIYTLSPVSETRFDGKWGGIYIPVSALIEGVESLPPLREVAEAFEAEGLDRKLEQLDRIPKKVIESYLDNGLIKSIIKNSQDTGYLELTRK